jgi:hypothetical protein
MEIPFVLKWYQLDLSTGCGPQFETKVDIPTK